MPIDADDWNALIDTVRGTLEVAAAQDVATSGTLDLRYAPVDHEHLAQVTTEWLAAELRTTVGGGGPAPSVTATIAGVAARLPGGPAARGGRPGAHGARGPAGAHRPLDHLRPRPHQGRRRPAHPGRHGRASLRGTVGRAGGPAAGARPARSRTSTACAPSLTDVTGATIDVGALQGSVPQLLRAARQPHRRAGQPRPHARRARPPRRGRRRRPRWGRTRQPLRRPARRAREHGRPTRLDRRRRRNSAPPPTSGRPSCAPT